jgi:cell fate (sporulation/competence/biofilm development) regulator YlbF (YheA/YmcA/DUF963 family)
MQLLAEDSVIIEKTRELCQTILDQPEFQNIRQQMESFLGDEAVQSQYQLLSEKGELLQFKQQQGQPLTNEEVSEFEQQRETFISNPVAQGFITAQQEMQKVQESVTRYLSKTFELGRVPAQDDVSGGSCGSGCGCH